MTGIVNLAFYYFFDVPEDIHALRDELRLRCWQSGFKGTILLAPEGINVMICGERIFVSLFEDYLRELIGEKGLHFKESFSDYLPFNRMLVKVKSQIIPVNDPEVNPKELTAPRLSPEELKSWMDEGRDLVLLDTRNGFEYDLGTFEGAKQIDTRSFRQFEDKVKELPEEWKNKEVVTFCTGGVRCEKATPIMMKLGFKKVYQLDGGILNYFERVGAEHYKGDCFVFDQRTALNPALEEVDVNKCFNCGKKLTIEDKSSKKYHYGVCCPDCYRPGMTDE